MRNFLNDFTLSPFMQDIKNKIEAVLFITGRPMSIAEIAQFCNIGSVGAVKDAMDALLKDYTDKNGSLEILFEDDKYRLNIKRQYNYLSTKLLSACELDAPTQATLALIAYKQPALQAEIIKMRGNTAYDHIHALKEMEFIVSEKSGRTRELKLAPKFFDYFDVVEETLKKKFGEVAEKQEKLVKSAAPVEAPKDVAPSTAAVEAVKIRQKRKKQEEAATAPVATEEHVQRIPREVLLSLDADDFGK